MVSRRNYMTIMIMMGVIFFLFLFIGVGKEQLNEYEINAQFQARTTDLDENTQWSAPGKTYGASSGGGRGYVLLVGDKEGEGLGNMIGQWCRYTKRRLETAKSIERVNIGAVQPEIMVLDAALVRNSKDIAALQKLAEQGVSMVFCGLPDMELLQRHQSLRKLLGIYSVEAPQVELTGVHLYGGFLLGGESIYKAENEREEKRQDMQLRVPWCIPGYGTKVYMGGMLEDERIKNEELPAIIWRAAYGDAKIFVVNGDYMEDVAGLGILSAMITQLRSYDIYPVVNAQNLTVVAYPALASENNEKMQQIYARDQKAVLRDVVGPGVTMIAEVSGFKISAMLVGEMDYDDKNIPKRDPLVYYLKQLNARQGEMGLSFSRVGGGDPERAERCLDAFLQQTDIDYDYASLYLGREDAANSAEMARRMEGLRQYPTYQKICTVVSDYAKENPILSYLSEGVTFQSGIFDGYSHTYSENLKLKGIETVLGYSNVILHLERVLWPEEETDRWEKLYDEFSSNINTYWKPFRQFETTTLIESDQRTRRFLALDYEDERQGDTILLDVKNFEECAYFLLRTQGETIVDIQGAEYQEAEQDVFLIKALQEHVEISLKQELEVYYSENKEQ